MEQKKIKFRSQYDDTELIYTEPGVTDYYGVDWEMPKAYIDDKTGEIVQAHGDPKPIVVKKYNMFEKIQASKSATDMFAIIQRALSDPGAFTLTADMCADTSMIPDNFTDLSNFNNEQVSLLFKSASDSYDKLTDEQKEIIGSKENLYNAVLNNTIDSILKNEKLIKKEEVVNNA